jgi:hypothetical protein
MHAAQAREPHWGVVARRRAARNGHRLRPRVCGRAQCLRPPTLPQDGAPAVAPRLPAHRARRPRARQRGRVLRQATPRGRHRPGRQGRAVPRAHVGRRAGVRGRGRRAWGGVGGADGRARHGSLGPIRFRGAAGGRHAPAPARPPRRAACGRAHSTMGEPRRAAGAQPPPAASPPGAAPPSRRRPLLPSSTDPAPPRRPPRRRPRPRRQSAARRAAASDF